MNIPRPLAIALLLFLPGRGLADEKPGYRREEDLIYGRKFGVALTLDVFRPEELNGAGVIFVIRGGFPREYR